MHCIFIPSAPTRRYVLCMTEGAGLATCIELCVKALRLESSENTEVKISICKTISCLLPDDLEVKRACQLSEFLIEPTVDAYYAVEMLYNQPDQKYDEENLPIPNSLRCELLLVLKTQWPFDPEFWDWKTLKRQCLALMGEEASIVSSIDELNDSEVYEKVADYQDEVKETSVNGLSGGVGANSELLKDIGDEKQKKREIKQLRERGFISARFRNWQAYMQYCVLCDKEFLGHRIVRHAQKHYKDGIYSCPICAKNFSSKETFVPHVTLHVKQSSKERLAAMKPLRRLGRPPKVTTSSENQKTNTVTKQEQRPIKKNSLYSTDFIVFNDNDGSDDENDDKDKSYEPEVVPVQKPVPVNEFNCPVSFCKKGFKYFKNLIAHVKGHKDNEDAKRFLEMQSKKVICQYCRRHFVSVTHLNDHLQMHCGSKPYICIQMKCKAGFNSYAELLTHRKEHQVFRAKCMFPKCGRIFSEAYLLYDHEAQHYNTFTCKFTGCGKVYRSQSELEKHLEDHSTPPEKVPPTDDQLHVSGESVQPSKTNQNMEENTEKERSIVPSENNTENSLPVDRNGAWEKSKEESVVTKQDQISASDLTQANGPVLNDLENVSAASLLQASEVAVSIKVSLNQGIEDNFGKQENSTVEGTSGPLATNLHTSVEETCNDLCHPGFQERKEQSCFNEAQITPNSLVNSETLKLGDLTPQNFERQVNDLMTFSVQNQAGFQNTLPASKFECEETIKASSNLYNLPIKTLDSITFVPPQPTLSSSLGTSSVPPKAPVQKFSCQVEGCTRTYNSSQSIGKHMKTAHPDQYAAFKMQRKSKKAQKSNNLNTPNNGKFVYFLPSQVNSSNNAFFTPQTKAGGNPACSAPLQHVSPSIFPAHLSSVSTPLLPSMESVINPNISAQDKNEPSGILCTQVENLSNATLPAQMEDLTKTVLPLNIDSGSDPFLPLPAESSSMSLFPSPADSGTNSVFSQLENNTNHYSSQIEGSTNSSFLKGVSSENAVFPSQINVANDFSSAQQSVPEKVKKDRGRSPNGKERKPKHNKRAKWPAIIRDGKFICSRCYRAFTNPRSLGGHLSKRSYCKPLDGAEIAQELLQNNGQPSLLASMILSTNAVNLQQPQQSTFNPDACFKDPSFLQLLAAENRATFLSNTFPRSGVTNYNSVSQEGSEIIKQALETAGIPSTFEGSEMLSQVVPSACVSDATQVNATVMPNSTVPPPLLQTACHPNSLLTNQNTTPNSKTSSIEDCSSLSVFPTNDLLLKTVENGVCSSSFPNSNGPVSQNFTSNNSRVSVISGPQNTRANQLNKKGNSASKRRKKVTPPLIAPNASQNMITGNLTAMGLTTKSIEMPTTTLHSNVLPNCEPQRLVENLTQKLNNVDNQLFMTDGKENFKTTLESHTALAPLTLKTENGDSQMMTLNSCTTSANSDLQISEDHVMQNFEKTLEIIKTAMNSQILEVKSGSQVAGEISQNTPMNYNTQLPSVNTVQNNKLPDSPQFSSFVSVVPTKNNIAQAEVLNKEDQIQEILEGLQRLKLENDLSSPESQCILINASVALTPTPVKPLPNVTAVQPVSEVIHIQVSDKVNKPFVCQNQGCNYSAMTKDALFKHYGKIHQYTPEMILEIKKNQLKFAPFKCVVPTCTKTFTRNSNLRAHCQLVHHFTTEEMVKLKIKRPYGRKSQSENMSTPQMMQVKKQPAVTEENKKEFHPPLQLGVETESTVSNIVIIPEQQSTEKKSPEKTESSSQVITVSSEQHSTNCAPNIQTKGRKVRKHKKEKEEKKGKRPVSQSVELPTRYSPYRPYRCVHQGCFAAFTIQQNLILHYQAVHKSDLPAFSAEVEEESEAGKESEETESKHTMKEFRCQVSDCSRIFQAITGLIQHYMKLHEMTPEEIESMTASVDVGKFSCDQSECKSSFTTYLNYVVHLEADHGIGIKTGKTEEDGVYKCDCEGCDRIYATRSNLLRHIFNKHNDKHKAHLIRPRRSTPGQENISNKPNQEKSKSKYRGTKHSRSGKDGIRVPKTKRKKKSNLENKNAKIIQIEENKPYSLKRGKHVYSIKARNDALSECTSRFVTQYPCMIKGCTSVVTSESNIIRHYKCHKLSKAFTAQHRSLLIVFKRCSNSEGKENSEQECNKSDVKDSDTCLPEVSDSSETTAVPPKEIEKSEKDEMDELTELFITKLINEDSATVETQANTTSNISSDFQEGNSSQSERQKTSNLKRVIKEKNVSQTKKRKVEKAEPVSAVALSNLRKEEETAVAIQTTEEHPASFDWSSFKPMGFEVSFLKFLEESAVKQKKNTEKDHPNSGTKRGSHSNSRKSADKTAVTSGNHMCSCKESETFVQFANPSQLQCSSNVKIVLDKTLKDCTELVLKQLQEMKPTVSLKKLEVHSNDPDKPVKKETSIGKTTGRGQY
ncbi:zinc finger protein 292 isoform X4 [Ochotona curzoniae]|uniref:zinc finger protein 292 isoform X4 n=1 Tax=Ochotona curzoniae TaxID=130825 RepID=UPI001B34C9D2|nr:zinc finger protein 292 isoform X4 [Ochotona curzoniae]